MTRDPNWLLGLAALRAQQIVELVEMFTSGKIDPHTMVRHVLAEARAILNNAEPAA